MYNKIITVRLEVFMTVTMKNAAFWDIKTQFIPHRKHILSLLYSPAGYVRFEVFTEVIMKKMAFFNIIINNTTSLFPLYQIVIVHK
jgi:hypothetical protein